MKATSKLTFSIVIPSKSRNEKLDECIRQCLKLKYITYEIIVLVEKETNFEEHRKNVKIIITGSKSAGEKRNIGIKNARGSFLAFIDDDAFPQEDWLANAEKYFEDESIAAVGGPHLTPKSNEVNRQASGYVLASYIGGGSLSYEYTKRVRKPMEVKYLASCNLVVRKSVMEKVGGFNTKYWPGEDTKLSWDISKNGGRLIYAPNVIVYHHRRSLFKEHLLQISNYALHSGFFLKKFSGPSFGITYFLPSLFVLFLLFGFFMSLLNDFFRLIYVILVSTYFLIALLESVRVSIKVRNLKVGIYVFFGIVATHIYYGIFFLKGLTRKELKN